MKPRACVMALAFLLAGCATEGGGGGVDFYGGYYYGYDDWWYGGGACCVDLPDDIGPPGPRPEHPIALPPDGGARPENPIAQPPSQPKAAAKADASPARSMPAPRPAAPMRSGGGMRGGGGGRR